MLLQGSCVYEEIEGLGYSGYAGYEKDLIDTSESRIVYVPKPGTKFTAGKNGDKSIPQALQVHRDTNGSGQRPTIFIPRLAYPA